jgi:hypothetical protein
MGKKQRITYMADWTDDEVEAISKDRSVDRKLRKDAIAEAKFRRRRNRRKHNAG